MWVVITEWDDGTVAATVVLSKDEKPILNPTNEQIDKATWLVASELARDGDFIDKDAITRKGSGRQAHFVVNDQDDVYAQESGKVYVD